VSSHFWLIPDEVWAHVEPWIPQDPERKKGSRRGVNHRKLLEGMIFQRQTRCSWEALPERFGDAGRLESLQRLWADAGVFHILFFALVHYYSASPEVDLSWCIPEGLEVVLAEQGSAAEVAPDEVRTAAWEHRQSASSAAY
jgi:hypothetical protein